MPDRIVRVTSRALPTIEWGCRCGHRRFVCSERFRMNVNGKLADIWLIYRCERCQATKNVTVLERAPVSKIDPALFTAATQNDAATARAIARDVSVLSRGGIAVASGDAWQVQKACSPRAEWVEPVGMLHTNGSNDVAVSLVFVEPLLVRLDGVIAAAIGISRRAARGAVRDGALSVEPGGRVDRLRLWSGVIEVDPAPPPRSAVPSRPQVL